MSSRRPSVGEARRLWGDDTRAVTAQVGAVLLLGLFVVLISIYQVTVIPASTAEHEFDHNQRVQDQLVELRGEITQVGTAAATGSESVSVGLRYPRRYIAINPPPAAGTLKTSPVTAPSSTVAVVNSTAVNSETADYWTGTQTFSTQSLSYDPGYNEYHQAPKTRYENTVLYNSFDKQNQNLTVTGQTVVSGRQLSLVTLSGDLNTQRIDAQTVDLRTVSPSVTSVNNIAIKSNASTRNVTLSFSSQLSEQRWERLLEDEMVQNGGYVTDVSESQSGTQIHVTLRREKGGDTVAYDLRIVNVSVSPVGSQPDAEYLTVVGANRSTVTTGETATFTVEVRDRYNNPVTGTRVNARVEMNGRSDGRLLETGVTSDRAGHATFRYRGTDGGTDNVTLSINDTDREKVRFTIDVVDPGTAIDVDNGAPGVTSITLRDAPIDESDTGSQTKVDVVFDEKMDKSATPVVRITGLTRSYSVSQSDYSDNGGTSTWTGVVAFEDDDEEATGTVEVADARDTDGNTIATETTTFKVDTVTPAVSGYSVTGSGGEITVSFNTNEQLSEAVAYLNDASGTNETTFTLSTNDFTETNNGDGTYTYEATETGLSDDTYTISLTKAADSVGNDGATGQTGSTQLGRSQAESVNLRGEGSTSGNSGKVRFTIENTGSADATVVGIAINNTTSDAERVSNGDILAADGTQVLTTSISIDDTAVGGRQDFTTNVSINQNDGPVEFEFDKFRKSGRGNPNVNMAGETIYVTLFLSDGSQTTFGLTVPA